MKSLLILFLFFTSHSLFGQGNAFFNGYIITINNDTINGLLNNGNFMNLKFKDNSGKIYSYNASQIKGYRIRSLIFESHIAENKQMPFFFLRLIHNKLDLFYCKGGFGDFLKGYYYMDTTISNNLIEVPRQKNALVEFLQKYYEFDDATVDLVRKKDFDYFELNDFIENNTKNK